MGLAVMYWYRLPEIPCLTYIEIPGSDGFLVCQVVRLTVPLMVTCGGGIREGIGVSCF
jgi:hypothetical protein